MDEGTGGQASQSLQAGLGSIYERPHGLRDRSRRCDSPSCCVRPPAPADSSEAMLSGRKPPFRLLVKAVSTRGQPISIRHAVSEGFVVATRRTRTAGKVRGGAPRHRGGGLPLEL